MLRVRIAKRLTQLEMAELFGMSESGIQKLEREDKLPFSKEKQRQLAAMAAECGEAYP